MKSRSVLLKILLMMLLSLGQLSSAQAADNWVNQTSGTSENLFGVYFVDSNIGWAVGTGGTILKTTNGGTSWSAQESGTVNRLDDVHFINNTTGWAAGFKGTVLKTSDGGTSWISQDTGTGADFFGVHFVDENTGWVVGRYTILKTIDGGANWVTQGPGAYVFYGTYFLDANTGWAVGSGGTILRTINGGTDWIAQSSGTGVNFDQPFFINANTGWAVAEGGVIVKTTNGGTNWLPQVSGTGSVFEGVYFVDADTGWAVAWDGVIRKTTNGGATWVPESSGTSSRLRDINIVNGEGAWIVGHDGTILKKSLAPPNTPAGSGVSTVTVNPDPALEMTFSDVTIGGNTTVTISSNPVSGPPSGFRFRGNQFDISTDASYTPPITITMNYDESLAPGNEDSLKMFHWNGSGWEDVTVSVDTVNNTITGQTNSLSPFILGGPTPPTGANSGGLIALAIAGIGLGSLMVWRKPRLTLS